MLYDMVGLARWFPGSGFGAYRLPTFNYNSERQPAPQPMASCFLLTRKAYEVVGGMDERFPLYFNDVDWCKRASDLGVGIWYTSRAVFVHGWGKTTGRSPHVAQVARWESHRALLRYWQLHHWQREQGSSTFVVRVLLTVLVTLRAWVVTKRWGESLGKNGGETTPESLRRELERTK
jgi:GT2 family glycosyltransferase